MSPCFVVTLSRWLPQGTVSSRSNGAAKQQSKAQSSSTEFSGRRDQRSKDSFLFSTLPWFFLVVQINAYSARQSGHEPLELMNKICGDSHRCVWSCASLVYIIETLIIRRILLSNTEWNSQKSQQRGLNRETMNRYSVTSLPAVTCFPFGRGQKTV